VRLAHENQSLRRGQRWRAKEDSVHDAEHGRRSANAERESEESDDRESRLPAVRSDGDARVGYALEKPVGHGGILGFLDPIAVHG